MNKVIDYFENSAEFLLLFITQVLIVTNLLFIFKIPINIFDIIIPFALSIIIYSMLKKQNFKTITLTILLSIFILSLSTFLIGKVYDSTADGNTYHKLAVGAMKNGWNPVYGSVGNFNKNKGNPFDIYNDNANVNWVDHYAKGTETFAAVIYYATGNIECGKVFNILWVYIGLFILFKLFRMLKFNSIKSFVLSCILAFNPISLVQIFNYYLDGVIAISLFIIILICIIQRNNLDKKINNELYAILFCSLVWAVNTKFNGLAYAGVFCLVLYLYRHIRNYIINKKEFAKPLVRDTVFYIIVIICSACIVGAGSYAKNMIDHGAPLYPLYGKNHIPSMIMQEVPKSMVKYSPAKQFIVSIFAKGENVAPSYADYADEPDLKIPFTTSKSEINNYTIPDIRMGGFGPLFSGIFVLSAIGLIGIFIQLIKNKRYDDLILTSIVVITIILLICLIDGSYWARYIPYFYLLPVLVLAYYMENTSKSKAIKLFSILVMLLFAFNSISIFGVQVLNTYRSKKCIEYRKELFVQYANSHKTIPIHLNHHGIQGVLYNLDDWKIKNYKLTEKANLKNDAYNFYY